MLRFWLTVWDTLVMHRNYWYWLVSCRSLSRSYVASKTCATYYVINNMTQALFTFLKTCELCFLLATTVKVWLKTWFHCLKIKRKKKPNDPDPSTGSVFWAALSKTYSCLWTFVNMSVFWMCAIYFSVTNKWYYIDISIKLNNILKLWKEIVPYCNEFCLARLGMQFTININCSKRKKET